MMAAAWDRGLGLFEVLLFELVSYLQQIFQLPCKVLTCAFHPNLDILKDMLGWADHEDAEFPWNTIFSSSDGRYLKMNFKSLKAWNSDSFTGVLETKVCSDCQTVNLGSETWAPHFGPAVLRNLASVLRKVSFRWSWGKLVLDNMFHKKAPITDHMNPFCNIGKDALEEPEREVLFAHVLGLPGVASMGNIYATMLMVWKGLFVTDRPELAFKNSTMWWAASSPSSTSSLKRNMLAPMNWIIGNSPKLCTNPYSY